MNWRHGMFRGWVVISGLHMTLVTWEGYSGVANDFDRASVRPTDPTVTLMVRGPCTLARGIGTTYYEIFVPKPGCWYDMPKLRELYPEYSDLADRRLSDGIYNSVPGAQEPLRPPAPWIALAKLTGLAAGIPTLVLIAGLAIGWVLAGFRTRRLN